MLPEIHEMRQELIKTITSTVAEHEQGVQEIELDIPLIYQYIDDQTNETLCRINLEAQYATLDDMVDLKNIDLIELDLEMLMSILHEVKHRHYKVTEILED